MHCLSVGVWRALYMVSQYAVSFRHYIFCIPFGRWWNYAKLVLYNTPISLCNEQFLRRRQQGDQSHLPSANPLHALPVHLQRALRARPEERPLIMFHSCRWHRAHKTGWLRATSCFVSWPGFIQGSLGLRYHYNCSLNPLTFTSPVLRNLINSDRDMKYSKEAPATSVSTAFRV